MSSVLIAGGLLLGLLGGVLAMGVFSSGVARRIGRLRENTARLAEGAPLRSLPTGEDEIGRLGTSMEETAIRLREAESDRDRFFTLSIDLLCVANFDGYFTRLNPAWEQVLGYSPQDLMGKPFIAFVHPDDRQRTVSETTRLALGNESVSFENRYRRRDGEYRWLLWTARPDPERGLIFAAARDITDRKEAEHDLRQLAIVDELTGLHNRRGFTSLAQHQLEVARRQGTPGAVLYADLDGMKHINDTFGHAEGDRALMDTAEIIRATLRGSDLVARLGGDEFCALLPDCGPGTAEMVMDRLQEAVRTFNSSSDRPFTLALSAGIVPYDPRADSDVEGLIERADRAMYRVKADRRTRSG
jgi:diguanylate cyclase (GGDEF)-like protein/PAS domain S-box-containing protein